MYQRGYHVERTGNSLFRRISVLVELLNKSWLCWQSGAETDPIYVEMHKHSSIMAYDLIRLLLDCCVVLGENVFPSNQLFSMMKDDVKALYSVVADTVTLAVLNGICLLNSLDWVKIFSFPPDCPFSIDLDLQSVILTTVKLLISERESESNVDDFVKLVLPLEHCLDLIPDIDSFQKSMSSILLMKITGIPSQTRRSRNACFALFKE